MITITASCPTCGSVTLTADEVELQVFPDGTADDFYAFTCPQCRGRVAKPADPRVVRLLRSGGVEPVATWPHPEAPPADLPPVNAQDVLAFRELLARHDFLSALVEERGC